MAKKIIDVSEKKKKLARSTRLVTWVVIGIVVLVVAGVLAVVIWLQQKNSQTTQAPPKTTPNSIVKEALEGKDRPSESELKAALAKNPTSEERQQLLQFLSSEAQERGDYETAVSYLKQAYEGGVTVAILVQNIAILYQEKLQDKPQALKYYKIARQLAQEQKDEDPYGQKTLDYINEKVKQLEAEGVTPAP